ncbi:unnamed protein product [Periconia digitata]|uniref:Uncharacterized protein n=1 Tax=Periconia digitata TaxID=1303443 RepID=A0A9W4UPB1_9PLEO|nr:unnamed protein product [Periconia digitata]
MGISQVHEHHTSRRYPRSTFKRLCSRNFLFGTTVVTRKKTSSQTPRHLDTVKAPNFHNLRTQSIEKRKIRRYSRLFSAQECNRGPQNAII